MVRQVSTLDGGLVTTGSEICLFSHQCSPENVQCTYNFFFFFLKIYLLSPLLKALSQSFLVCFNKKKVR